MDKWAAALESSSEVLTVICKQVELENPELREEGFKWMLAHLDGIKCCDHKLMIKPLVSCLTDKKSTIRS